MLCARANAVYKFTTPPVSERVAKCTFFFFVPQDAKLFQMPGYKDVSQFGATLNNMEKYQYELLKKNSQLKTSESNQTINEK